jgi:outer membrane protein assembly factor BamA
MRSILDLGGLGGGWTKRRIRRGGSLVAATAALLRVAAQVAFIGVILLSPGGSSAIEELEAEENISDLLPAAFPGERVDSLVAERPWAILPQVGFGPDTGVVGGVKFAHRNVYGTGITFDVDGTYSLKRQRSLAVSLGSGRLFQDRIVLLVRAKYDFDPQREFFGLGNNDVGPDPASTHEFQEIGGAVTLGWRPFERVAFNFAIGARQVDIRRGEVDGNTPSTVDAFPDLPGVNGGVVNPIAVSLVWNTRDNVMRPTRGGRLLLKIIHTNKMLLSDFEFTRFIGDAGYLRSFSHGRYVFGLRVNGEWIVAPDEEVPFWELAELGGQDTLRGFFPHRFVGKGRVLLNGEARSRIIDFDFFALWHVYIDGVVFGDGGRVFLDRKDLEDEFQLGDTADSLIHTFQYSYGGGLRFKLSEALVARVDVGFSDEEQGLVYLSFGQTF